MSKLSSGKKKGKSGPGKLEDAFSVGEDGRWIINEDEDGDEAIIMGGDSDDDADGTHTTLLFCLLSLFYLVLIFQSVL